MQIIQNKKAFFFKTYAAALIVCIAMLSLQWLMDPMLRVTLFYLCTLLLLGCTSGTNNTIPKFLRHAYIVCLYFLMVTTTALSGGIFAPTITWFLFCPLISFITLSHKASKFWLVVIILTIGLFFTFPDVLVAESLTKGNNWHFISVLIFVLNTYRVVSTLYLKITRKKKKPTILKKALTDKQKVLLTSQQGILHQDSNLMIAESSVISKNNELEKFLNLMLEISRMEELHNGDLEYSLQTLQRELFKSLQPDGVQFWQCNANENSLECICSISNDKHFALNKEQTPNIAELLEAGIILQIKEGDAELDEVKISWGSETKSLLACPYFMDGKFAGFISCTTNTTRRWATEEVIFVRAIADAVTLSFRSKHKKEQQFLLIEKQLQIQELNESLEGKVARRTAQLKVKNDQLSEFAFINAHKIRGPVCRLLGLSNLLSMASDPNEVLLLGSYISISIKEVDAITRKANEVLSEQGLIT